MMDQFFPCRFFISECFKQGQLPLWSPYINYGYPFHADPQSGAFYPITWLISIWGGYNVYTIATEYLLHILIAAFSFFALLRQFKLSLLTSTVFGVIYALSGIFISNAQHLTWVVSMAWMPLVIMFFYKLLHQPRLQNALAFSLTAYFFMTGGYPGFAIILFYFLVAYACLFFVQLLLLKDFHQLKKNSATLTIGAAIFLFISSGFFYSIILAMPDIARSKPVTLGEANSIAFTPPAAISFLFPFVNSSVEYSYSTDTDISMTNIYMGVFFFPFFLLGLWRGHRNVFQHVLLIFGLICLLAAVGNLTPIRTWMYHYLPGMNVFRHAAIFRAISILSLLTIAATGFEKVILANTARSTKSTISLLSVLLFGLISLFAFIAKNQSEIKWLGALNPASILVFNQSAPGESHLLFQALVQIGFVIAFIIVYVSTKVVWRNYLLALLLLMDISFAAYINLPSTAISDVSPMHLQAELEKFPSGFPVPPLTPIGDFSYGGNIHTSPMWFNLSFFTKVPSWGGFNNFYPKGIDDLKETPTEQYIWQQPVAFFANNMNGSPLALTKFNPGHIELVYQSTEPTTITLLQSYFKGWQATCDGQPLTIHKAYQNFIQCHVPTGKHKISYAYNPPYTKHFILVGVVSLLISSLSLWYLAFKRTDHV